MGRDAVAAGRAASPAARFQLPLMFVVMAVQAQQFPVAAIRRVVVVIVVAVMNRQLAKVGVRKFPGAATADPRIDLERLLAITLLTLFGSATGLGHDAVEFARLLHD